MHFARRTGWNLEPNRFAAAIAKARREGRELLDLTESNPTRCGLHYDESAILKSLLSLESLKYEPDPRGLRSARAAVARYYAERGEASLNVDPEHIILTTSTSEAYSYIFRLLCDAGDEVLVPAPSYPLFEFLAALQDITLRHYELEYHGAWSVDRGSLATSDKSRALMVVHPNNPTGSYVGDYDRALLREHCARHGRALISDEVFLDYAHDRRMRRSFASERDVLTFTLSGLSKIAALPQMKVAWMVVSGSQAERDAALARLEVIADTFLSMNAPLQHALPDLLAQRHNVREQLLQRVRANLAELDRQLATQKMCERLAVEGGWYATVRVPAHGSDEDLAIALLEQAGVLVHPGHFYEFKRDGYLVLSLITPAAIFREGVSRLLQHVGAR